MPAAKHGPQGLWSEPVSFSVGTATSPDPPFPTPPQEHTNWCWSAVAAAVAKAVLNRSVRQCELVSELNGRDSCPPAQPINEIASLDEVLTPILGIPARWNGPEFLEDGKSAYAAICASIDAGGPVPILIDWNASVSSHYVCAYAYQMSAGSPALWLYDPWKAWSGDRNRRLKTVQSMRAFEQEPNGGHQGFWSEAYLTRGFQ